MRRAALYQRTVPRRGIDTDGARQGGGSRFAEWEKVTHLPILFAGGTDVKDKFTMATAEDPLQAPWREVLEAWHQALGEEWRMVTDVLTRSGPDPESYTASASFKNQRPRLYEALTTLVTEGGGKGNVTATTVGHALRVIRNRVIGGYRLDSKMDRYGKTRLWRVTRV